MREVKNFMQEAAKSAILPYSRVYCLTTLYSVKDEL
jgi:hypothetical protein